jgi:hypothetical protein
LNGAALIALGAKLTLPPWPCSAWRYEWLMAAGSAAALLAVFTREPGTGAQMNGWRNAHSHAARAQNCLSFVFFGGEITFIAVVAGVLRATPVAFPL